MQRDSHSNGNGEQKRRTYTCRRARRGAPGAATQSERLKLAQLYHEHGAAEVRRVTCGRDFMHAAQND